MFRNLWERMRATPAWIWITIAIAAAGLVISFLIYRNSANGPAASGTAGDTSGGSVSPGDVTGGYSPYGNGSSQYQPDYSTQSLLQQIINLLSKPATPAPSPAPTPIGGDAGGMLPGPIPGPIQPRVPPIQPHPISGGTSGGGVTTSPGGVTRPQQTPSVHGSVVHSDAGTGSVPHPGAVAVNAPHPYLMTNRAIS